MSTPANVPLAAEALTEPTIDEVADADALRDTAGDGDEIGGRAELPMEADPADVAEQDAAVPYDDDVR